LLTHLSFVQIGAHTHLGHHPVLQRDRERKQQHSLGAFFFPISSSARERQLADALCWPLQDDDTDSYSQPLPSPSSSSHSSLSIPLAIPINVPLPPPLAASQGTLHSSSSDPSLASSPSLSTIVPAISLTKAKPTTTPNTSNNNSPLQGRRPPNSPRSSSMPPAVRATKEEIRRTQGCVVATLNVLLEVCK